MTATVRTALVTGGARGIGEAIALRLERDGIRVVRPTRQELDLAVAESVAEWVLDHRSDEFDILVNNAGINVLGSIPELDLGTFDQMLQVNLRSALVLVKAFAPGMASRGWGRILNVSTIFSLVTKEKRAAYSITKSAINALTRSAAVEFGADCVLVNALAPGYVETALTFQNNSPEAIEKIVAQIPLGRMAKVEELAECAAFLLSGRNTYLTGQTLVVDGGFTCL